MIESVLAFSFNVSIREGELRRPFQRPCVTKPVLATIKWFKPTLGEGVPASSSSYLGG